MTNIIPKYSLQFIKEDFSAREDAEKLPISNKTLTPADAPIPPKVLYIIEGIARDYMFNFGNQSKDVESARLSLSADQGIAIQSCSDSRIDDRLKVYLTSVAIVEEEARALGLLGIKRVEPQEEDIKQARERFKDAKVLYLDPWCFQFHRVGLKKPLLLDLEMTQREVIGKGAGLTSAPLRYPHLLKDLSNRLKKDSKICIVGPGLVEEENAPLFSPQFAEIYSLFPNGTFLLLDNDPHALKLMEQQFHKCKFAAYDPYMLRHYAVRDSQNFKPNRTYQKLFDSMKKVLAEKAIKPANAANMLAGVGSPERMLLKISPEKIEIRDFDIRISHFRNEEKFDAMVATMAFGNAFSDELKKDVAHNFFPHLQRFLGALNENGSLYIDKMFVNSFLKHYPIEKAIRYLALLVGNRLVIQEIPISGFQPRIKAVLGVIDSATISSIQKYGDRMTNITTSSLIVITRTPEKIQATQEDLEALEIELIPTNEDSKESPIQPL